MMLVTNEHVGRKKTGVHHHARLGMNDDAQFVTSTDGASPISLIPWNDLVISAAGGHRPDHAHNEHHSTETDDSTYGL